MKFIFSKTLSDTLAELAKIKHPEWEKPSDDFVCEKVKEYQNIWDNEIEEKYNTFLVSNLLARPHLECFVVAGTNRNMSLPMILKSRYTKDEFIPAILEEVLHRTFAFNKTTHKKITGNKTTDNHIPVFYALKGILRDTPEVYEAFKKEHKDPAYIAAFPK